MANPSKAKGTAAESAVVRWLQVHGFPFAERRALSGKFDKGDIAGIVDQTLEVKDCKTMVLGSWVDEAAVEAVNAGTTVYAVVHKRRGKTDPGEWFVTTKLSVWMEATK